MAASEQFSVIADTSNSPHPHLEVGAKSDEHSGASPG
jgi:hypothetical protein